MKKLFPSLLFLVFSSAAFASTDRFDYNPSDLANPAAIEKLHGQVQKFARRYCNTRTQTLRRFDSCVTGIEQELVEKIDNYKLSAYSVHGSHTRDVATISR